MNKKLIIALTIIFIIILSLFFLKKESLNISVQDQICSIDEDCVRVSTDCSGCECGVPVNKIYEEKYAQRYRKVCKNYRGGVCEFCCKAPYIRCQDNKCIRTNLTNEGKEVNPCG
ncbi:hypothetical protein J4234_01640 [Candidatus Woesearchaeota archaeon]|nr:hypothetical protein [Candidatus Woesearchaeota archaeon]